MSPHDHTYFKRRVSINDESQLADIGILQKRGGFLLQDVVHGLSEDGRIVVPADRRQCRNLILRHDDVFRLIDLDFEELHRTGLRVPPRSAHGPSGRDSAVAAHESNLGMVGNPACGNSRP